jgi:hypothetical protein
MKVDWQAWLGLQDQRIKNAQGDLVKSELRKLNMKSVPRKLAADVANLARRLNQSDLILQLLKRPFQNDREKALYALALARIGAYRESENLLAEVPDEDGTLMLWKASALISQWNYAAALKIYQKLNQRKMATPLEDIVVKVNLASCYIFLENHSSAIPILSDLSSIRSEFPLLYANSRELMAQALFGLGNFEMAEQMIQESLSLLSPGETAYSIFARKWNLLIRSAMGRSTEKDWIDLREQAMNAGDTETCRDLDWRRACAKKEASFLWPVYFGTPFESYRQRAVSTFPIPVEAPETFRRQARPQVESSLLIDLCDGNYTSPDGSLQIPSKTLKLLRALARDAYRPIPIGELFAAFYQNSYFDIHSSAHRLFQMVQWSRKFLKENQIPIEIRLANNAYSIYAPEIDFQVALIYPKSSSAARNMDEIQIWLAQRQGRHFTRKELQTSLQISKDRAYVWIQTALTQRWIKKQGQGNHIIYHPQMNRLKKTA